MAEAEHLQMGIFREFEEQRVFTFAPPIGLEQPMEKGIIGPKL